MVWGIFIQYELAVVYQAQREPQPHKTVGYPDFKGFMNLRVKPIKLDNAKERPKIDGLQKGPSYLAYPSNYS